jgi:hypothetical protein
MYSVQAVAGGIFFLAVAGFGWIAIRLATYPAPWSLPWQKASIGGPWAPINATIRFAVLAGVTVVAAWPYFQGGAPVWGNNSGGGWGIVAAPVHRASGDLTWLLIVLAVAGAIAVGLLVVRLLPARRRRQRTAPSRAPVANEVPTLSELTDETLKAMTSERDPRRAILACYARMERGLANRGIPRNPEETALEYMRRLLERAGAPSAPLQSLTRLFQLAGFSAQPLDESMRETAISALRAISAGTP